MLSFFSDHSVIYSPNCFGFITWMLLSTITYRKFSFPVFLTTIYFLCSKLQVVVTNDLQFRMEIHNDGSDLPSRITSTPPLQQYFSANEQCFSLTRFQHKRKGPYQYITSQVVHLKQVVLVEDTKKVNNFVSQIYTMLVPLFFALQISTGTSIYSLLLSREPEFILVTAFVNY